MANISTNDSQGSVENTQNPQAVGQSSLGASGSKTIQGTNSASILYSSNSSSVIRLGNANPDIVSVNASTSAYTQPKTNVTTHHANGTLLVFVVVLVVVAFGLFLNIGRTSKTTTK